MWKRKKKKNKREGERGLSNAHNSHISFDDYPAIIVSDLYADDDGSTRSPLADIYLDSSSSSSSFLAPNSSAKGEHIVVGGGYCKLSVVGTGL
jgi:hypothetical protein